MGVANLIYSAGQGFIKTSLFVERSLSGIPYLTRITLKETHLSGRKREKEMLVL